MRKNIKNILTWSEQYTKTDMKYLARGGFWLSLGQIGSAFVAFLFAILIAKIIPKEEYGNYKYILATVALANTIALSGLAPALVRAVAGGFEGTYRKFYNLNLAWSFIPASPLTLASIYYYSQNNLLLSVGLLVGGLTLPFLDSGELYNSFLNGKKMFSVIGTTQLIRSLLSTIVVAIVAYYTKSPLYMAIAYFIIHTILVSTIFIYTLYKYKPNKSEDPSARNLAKHTSLINLFAIASDQLDNILIFQFIGATPLAVYNFAEAIPNTLGGLLKQLGILATPKFVDQDKEKAKQSILRKSLVIFLSSIPIVAVYYFAAPYVFQIFFPNYLDSVFYSQIIAFGLLINGSIPVAFLDAHKAIREKYTLSLVSNIVKIPLLIFSCFYFGLLGLIIAKITSKLIGLLTSFVLIKRV